MSRSIKNIVYMGTPDFAAGILEKLLKTDYVVQAVYTQPDKPRGRSGKLAPTPVKEVALNAGIPVHQPLKIREAENFQQLKEYAPDVIVVAAFGQIIPKSILDLPAYGCINVHASLLPKYRGAAPIQWAVIDGEKESGVTTMQMGEGLDTGDMLKKAVVALAPDETGGSLFDRLMEAGGDLLIDTLQSLEKGEITPEKQPEESPTPYAAMLTKAHGRIDWSKSAVSIERLVRGLDPWPSAYTAMNNKQLKIWKTHVADASETEGLAPETVQNGTILAVTKKSLLVKTGDGILAVDELQLEGKKRMPVDAFLRGYSLQAGVLLG